MEHGRPKNLNGWDMENNSITKEISDKEVKEIVVCSHNKLGQFKFVEQHIDKRWQQCVDYTVRLQQTIER